MRESNYRKVNYRPATAKDIEENKVCGYCISCDRDYTEDSYHCCRINGQVDEENHLCNEIVTCL